MSEPRARRVAALRLLGQWVLYGAFAAAIGYFATAPAYVRLAPDQALIKLSFSHAAAPLGECRERTPQELAQLPPNMRAPLICPRERSPVELELALDGRTLLRTSLPPRGWQRDGAATLYQTYAVPAGRHRLRVRLKDDARLSDFNYVREEEIALAPGQVFVVDFDPRRGGFVFK